MSIAEQPLVQIKAALICKTGPPLYYPAGEVPLPRGIRKGPEHSQAGT